LQDKTEAWTPKILQINVPEANIVDRCDPVTWDSRAGHVDGGLHGVEGKKPDDYARAFTSHPERDLLRITITDKVRLFACHQGNGRATTSVEKAHGTYEHCSGRSSPGEYGSRCQTCQPRTWCCEQRRGLDAQLWQRSFPPARCVGCHR